MRCCLKYELSGGRSIHESSVVADFPTPFYLSILTVPLRWGNNRNVYKFQT